MDNLRPRILLQKRLRQQADNVVALNELTFFIEQEAAVKITVEGNPHIRTVFNHRIARVGPAFRQQRIRNTVGEVAIRRIVNFDELDRHPQRLKTGFNGVNHRTCRTVAGVEHQLHRFQAAGIDVTQQVVDVGIAGSNTLVVATFCHINRREVVGFRQALHVAQTGITADGPRPFPHQLHTVVIHRIMAGGHFNTAVNAKVEGGEVNLFGARHANIQHIHPRILQPFRQRQL